MMLLVDYRFRFLRILVIGNNPRVDAWCGAMHDLVALAAGRLQQLGKRAVKPFSWQRRSPSAVNSR